MSTKAMIRPIVVAVSVFFMISMAHSAGARADMDDTASKTAVSKLRSVWEHYRASVRHEALRAGKKPPSKEALKGSVSQWLKKVSPEEVNMVTNKVEKGESKSVMLNGKTYYVSNEGYASTLTRNSTLRFAADPMTGEKIDKSLADTYADAAGKVLYFASEKTYKEFLGLASSEEIHGYNEDGN